MLQVHGFPSVRQVFSPAVLCSMSCTPPRDMLCVNCMQIGRFPVSMSCPQHLTNNRMAAEQRRPQQRRQQHRNSSGPCLPGIRARILACLSQQQRSRIRHHQPHLQVQESDRGPASHWPPADSAIGLLCAHAIKQHGAAQKQNETDDPATQSQSDDGTQQRQQAPMQQPEVPPHVRHRAQFR